VGEFATAVQTRLRDALAECQPATAWETEHRIAGTPVDVAGISDGHLAVVELEWRRADPADNAAKLFRHLDAGAVETAVTVVHVFTEYYDLARGGVSAKRENAEFVGQMAADTFDRMRYTTVEFPLDPPARGGTWPDDWAETTDTVAEAISAEIGE
jgi:hypothetical protein